MKNHLVSLGFVLAGMAFGSAVARMQAPVAVLAQTTSPSPNAQMKQVTDAMRARLAKESSADVDRTYVNAMGAISPAVVSLCKKEISYGKNPTVRAVAEQILTVEQGYQAQIQQMEKQYHIDHTN